MTQNEKFKIRRRTPWRGFWLRLCGIPDAPVKLLFVALYLAGAVWVWSKHEAISIFAEGVEMISPIMLEMSRNVQSGNTQNLKSSAAPVRLPAAPAPTPGTSRVAVPAGCVYRP